MYRYSFWFVFVVVMWSQCAAAGSMEATPHQVALSKYVPSRPYSAPSGSQFADEISRMDARQREQAILKELVRGNLPQFLRKLVPVQLHQDIPNCRAITATFYVMPDYLAIGSDNDFLRIPMDLHTATAVAKRFGFILPTRKMVDAIYDQSSYHFKPIPMTPGPMMRSTEYYRIHNQRIGEQCLALGIPLGALVSGHKKDVVVTNLLATKPDRIAIYGWHCCKGCPIQPLSTVHGACYADYSHGVRLVSELVKIDGKFESIYKILQDPVLSKILSDEGAICNLRELIPPSPELFASSSDFLLTH